MTVEEEHAPGTVRLSGPELEVARAILVHGPVSRGALALRLGLSAASLTRLSKPLLDAGLVEDRDVVPDGSVGRPVRLLGVRAGAQHFIGIKITGTQAQGVLTDLRATTLARGTQELGSIDPAAVVGDLAALVRRLAGESPTSVTGVGLSIGGSVREHRLVERAPFLGWRDVDLGSLLAGRTGLRVFVDNDVSALVAAELWFGSGRGSAGFAVLTTGAGVGYGLAVHGAVIRTRDAGLGLGGHFPLDPHGPLCSQGHRGCSTAMLGIPAICAQVSAALGRKVDYAQVLELGGNGDPAASAVLVAAARALGRFIAAIANLAMVNTVVLGGEGMGLYPLFSEHVHAEIDADRDPEASAIALELIDPGYDQWARGAAAVAIQGFAFDRG